MPSHPTLKLIRLVFEGRLSPRQLVRRQHEHLAEACEACRTELECSLEEIDDLPWRSPEPVRWKALTEPPDEDRHVGFWDLERWLRLQRRQAKQRKRANRHLAFLRAAPPDDRAGLVENAVSRFRSRAFAELLVEESQRLVRTEPAEAESLASLVPRVVRLIPGAEGMEWAHDLTLQGLAWKANAQRVGGDLPAAVKTLGDLEQQAAERPPSSPWVRAELASVEASLRIDQRRTLEAQALLDRAVRDYRAAGDGLGVVKTLLQKAHLCAGSGATGEALAHLEQAAEVLPASGAPPHLHLSILGGRILALCDLGRPAEAEALFTASAAQLDPEDPFLRATVLGLDGRIGLAARDYRRAERSFTRCRDRYLQLGRHYDAALASLDLAQTHLESGRLDQLESLAADLVSQFRVRGVGRETLAALHLLAEAAQARHLTRDLLDRIRDRMRGASRTGEGA